MSGEEFNQKYFEFGIETGVSGYSQYRWLPELTIPMCARISDHLKMTRDQKVLDFGCAKGFMVKAFRLLGFDCHGVDISEYAVGESHHDVEKHLHLKREGQSLSDALEGQVYDWVVSKDVLEHVPYEMIDQVLEEIAGSCKRFFFVVPLGHDGKYVVPAYEHDTTHYIRETLDWWADRAERAGFTVLSKSYRMEGVKDNWSFWETGNGFFVCEVPE